MRDEGRRLNAEQPTNYTACKPFSAAIPNYRQATSGSYSQQFDAENRLLSVTHLPLPQSGQTRYDWTQFFVGGERNVGFYFFASAPTPANPGNAYALFQTATDLTLSKSVNNIVQTVATVPLTAITGKSYRYQILYDPTTGQLEVWRGGAMRLSWTDPAPLPSGEYLALRTLNSFVLFDALHISQPTALHYFFTDHLGSTTLLTDETGNPLPDTVAHYLPFGSYRTTPPDPTLTDRGFTRHSRENGNTATDRGFTGHRHNDELGLIYMNARYYLPSIGRFLTADTLIPDPANPQSYNRYSYTLNNPLNRIDPTGHIDCEDLGTEQCNDDGSFVDVLTQEESQPFINARVFYLNQIGIGNIGVIQPSQDPNDLEGNTLYRVGNIVGPENIIHIPIFTDDVNTTRFQMFMEMFEFPIWSPIASDAIVQNIRDNPLSSNERIIIIGNSGGGTVAVELLELLDNEGIFVDQLILRGSPVQERSLTNVGRVDYITSNADYYYSFDSTPFDGVDVQTHRVNFWGHVPPDASTKTAIINLYIDLIIDLTE